MPELPFRYFVIRRVKTMAMLKLQPLNNCCFPKPRVQSTADFNVNRKEEFPKYKAVHALKPPYLEISNSRACSPLSYEPWFSIGNASARKRVKVANTSLDRAIDLLKAYDDEYDGATIDPESLPSSANAFSAILQSSLLYWRLKGKKGIWLKLLSEQAELVPIAIKEGFIYHHAEPGYVVLTYWIPGEPCMLPATGSHQIGIGGFVMNENREVLVVKEKQCPLSCSGIWKIPTGFINKSEEIFSGAVREVKEETGIDTAFVEVVAFRHAHLVAFEKSDLFFICVLRPLTFDISIDEAEIHTAKWMALDELLSQPFYKDDCMSKKAIDVCIARHEREYKGFTAHRVISKFDDKLSYLYCGDLEESFNE